MDRKRIACILALVLIVGSLIPAISLAAVAVRQGDTGENVRKIQRRLIQYDYMDGTADGVFGSSTKAAVIKFQKKYGLTADGVVGPSTAAKLGVTFTSSGGGSAAATTSAKATATGSYSSSDVRLLARVVHAEARGEPYKGKVAVAAVVLNRVKSSQFPNTISGVVYQKNAFTCVKDGQINLEPSADATRAAKDAINGWDPSGGSIYYYNPKTSKDSWIFSRTTQTVIGSHRFAK